MRHSVRGLARSPGFAATLLFVLAMGIGANTAMFRIIDGMLIRSLPYPDGERIVRVGQEPRQMPGAPVYLSARAMAQIEETAESFEQLAAHEGAVFSMTSPDGARPWGMAVSPALLRLLGATPRLGRLFTDEEAQRGADGVVLLSHGAWTRRFGANPDVVGTVVDVRGERRTVVGVLAEGFYFPSPREEVWAPFVLPPDAATVVVLGRLREGVSAGQAATEVRAILQRMEGAVDRLSTGGASGRPSGDSQNRVRVIPLREQMVGEYRPALAALTAATALVLLIACINVAGLLLARGVSRQPTLAVCAALGAGRGRIVRQLLTESMVLSLGGGALGLARRGRRFPRCAGAGAGRHRAARRGEPRRRGARLHVRFVDGGRAGVRRRAGLPVVREPTAPHPRGERRAVHRRLRAAARQPGACRAGGVAGGAGAGAPDRRGPATTQLRHARDGRSRLRPDQRDCGQRASPVHLQCGMGDEGGPRRGASITKALLPRARRGDGRVGATSGRRGGRGDVTLTPRR